MVKILKRIVVSVSNTIKFLFIGSFDITKELMVGVSEKHTLKVVYNFFWNYLKIYIDNTIIQHNKMLVGFFPKKFTVNVGDKEKHTITIIINNVHTLAQKPPIIFSENGNILAA